MDNKTAKQTLGINSLKINCAKGNNHIKNNGKLSRQCSRRLHINIGMHSLFRIYKYFRQLVTFL